MTAITVIDGKDKLRGGGGVTTTTTRRDGPVEGRIPRRIAAPARLRRRPRLEVVGTAGVKCASGTRGPMVALEATVPEGAVHA